MPTLYSHELRAYIHEQPWPAALEWTIVEWPDNSCIKVVITRESINRLNGEDKLHLAQMMSKMLTTIQDKGVPIYTWVITRDEYEWRNQATGFAIGEPDAG